MKSCGYCGRQNDDATAHCMECGTSFTIEAPGKLADVWRWTPQSSVGRAFASGLASLLICTGVFYGASRVIGDWKIHHHFGGTVMPVTYDLTPSSPTGIPFHSFTWHSYESLVSLAALIFTFIVCHNRCQKVSYGIITAIIAFSVFGLLTVMPMFMPKLISFFWLVPMFDMVIMIGPYRLLHWCGNADFRRSVAARLVQTTNAA